MTDDDDLFEVDNFDINEEDVNKIVNEKEEKNFEVFYNYKTEKKKEEENDIVINDSIYYLPNLDTFRFTHFTMKNEEEKNEEEKKDEEKKEEEVIKEENEDKKISSNEEQEFQESQNINNKDENINNVNNANNDRITIKRVKLAPLKIENDYFKE